MTNVIVANLAKSRFYRASPVYQYNYGMKLKIVGVDLPDAYEVDFANDISGTSITQIGNADGVSIPSQFFTPGQAIYAWLRVHPTQDSGITTATIVIPISPRATITDEEPTPVEQSAIDQAIAALNTAVEHVDDAVEHYPTITGGIWYTWDVDAGEYVSTGIPARGAQGDPGADGYSPTASVSKTGNTATITITDKQGTTTANIANGAPGQDGTDGVGVPAGGTTGQVLSKASGTDYDTEWTTPEAGGVTDVQVNGTSVVTDGVANVPIASINTIGVSKYSGNYGVAITTGGQVYISPADSSLIKNPTGSYRGYKPIVAGTQHESVFYGLAKVSGDTTQSASSNAVGQYTDAAKSAIQTMLGISDIIAPTEGATASTAYAVGDAFLHGGKLYVASASIAASDAIVPGTNCTQTTIINLLKGV